MSLLARTSVIIPALNEESTVADVVHAVRADQPMEVIVIDSDSTDNTAATAEAAGARVVNWRDCLPISPQPGKGEALWRGVACARGDFVAFVDADLIDPAPGLVATLVEPFVDKHVQLVKAAYQRGFHGQPTGGGRVTELTAKPLLKIFFPELADLAQPLSGEYAMRTTAARSLPFAPGYGVEVGLVIDTWRTWGRAAIAEVDLGQRYHRNRPLEELAPMAEVVARTIFARAENSAAENNEFPLDRPALTDVL